MKYARGANRLQEEKYFDVKAQKKYLLNLLKQRKENRKKNALEAICAFLEEDFFMN